MIIIMIIIMIVYTVFSGGSRHASGRSRLSPPASAFELRRRGANYMFYFLCSAFELRRRGANYIISYHISLYHVISYYDIL